MLSGDSHERQGVSFEFDYPLCWFVSVWVVSVQRLVNACRNIPWREVRERVRDCGLSQKIRRETTLLRPILAVMFVVSSRHPLFWLLGPDNFQKIGYLIPCINEIFILKNTLPLEYWEKVISHQHWLILLYFGSFNTNYTIFKNINNWFFFKKTKFNKIKENVQRYRIFNFLKWKSQNE